MILIEHKVRLIAKQINDMAEMTPYVILVDGNGIMHERRAGIACFVGVRTGIRTVGVAKSFYNIDGLLRSEVRFNISEELYLFNRYISEYHEESVAVPYRRVIAMKRLDLRDKSFVRTRGSGPCKIVGTTKPFPLALFLNGSSGITWGIALVGHGGVGNSIKRRSRDMKGSNTPLFISIGHNVSLEDALVFCAKQCLFKIPEPIRQADLRGREIIRNKRDAAE